MALEDRQAEAYMRFDDLKSEMEHKDIVHINDLFSRWSNLYEDDDDNEMWQLDCILDDIHEILDRYDT